MKTISITTLGCDKNRCDSEHMATVLQRHGFTIGDSPATADVIIVNTCAFIGAARKEAIDTIVGLLSHKKDGACKKFVVTGCLPAKHLTELQAELPEVDLFLGTDEYDNIAQHIGSMCDVTPQNMGVMSGKLLSTPKSYAYIKIAEGCDNCCAYCTIPSIRGRYRSRARADILAEVAALAARGTPEFILVAQDTTKYWDNEGGGTNLAGLVRDISAIPGVGLVRLHYCYPDGVTDELITAISSNARVAKYIDIPLQHVSRRVLELMGRPGNGAEYTELIAKLRKAVPGIVIRSTFIVGLPTETDEDFAELCEWLATNKLDYVGFFAYSREPGTPAYSMPQIPARVKTQRLRTARKVQGEILGEKQAAVIGQRVVAVCDYFDYAKQHNVLRTAGMSPDVDPHVVVKCHPLEAGRSYVTHITAKRGGNLVGTLVEG